MDLNVEVNKGKCSRNCILLNVDGEICIDIFKNITGLDCTDGYILKKKKKHWVQCTKENTKVGDTVGYNFLKVKREISYVFKGIPKPGEYDCVVCNPNTGKESPGYLYNYEIEI
jgi:hypothetical protein